MSSQRFCRQAYTLIEMLVVIAIITILIALLLVGIQATRESSRLATCVNNLRQIGIALNAYHAAYERFPAASYVGHGSFNTPLFAILPQIERDDIRREAESKMSGPAIATAVFASRFSVPLFECPSDPAPSQVYDSPAKTNYLFNWGTRGSQDGAFVLAFRGFAPPPQNATSLSDFADGASNTDLFSEGLAGDGTPRRLSSLWSPDKDLTNATIDEIRAYWNAIPFEPTSKGWDGDFVTKGRAWSTIVGSSVMYNHVSGPNEVSGFATTPYPLLGDIKDGTLAASSAHTGGVNVLAADGHVQFISSGIDIRIWRARGTRNGKEVVSQE